ncbi:MAG: acetate kinase [Candidatus Kerfeldbacteria bacterium]|nr:acetate kinase [Candidatus Kerfeldbacteria bacterium]
MKKNALVLNVGSSSLKYAVARNRKIFFRGIIDHFGRHADIVQRVGNRRKHSVRAVPNLRAALGIVRTTLVDLHSAPGVVAHRIVHGGERYAHPTQLSSSVVRYLQSVAELAPLHQRANLLGVAFAKRTWPQAAEWGVFDTAIYRGLPQNVRVYAIPRNITKRLRIVKYGFHGTSHAWAFRQAAMKLHRPLRSFSAVTIHLGAGASMTLWQRGRPMDTTMGFTPLEGLVMATRSGSIDPEIPLFLQEKLGWSVRRVKQMLEYESGLKGLCGLHDMRDILGAAGHPVRGWPRRHWPPHVRVQSRQALNVFLYHIRRTLAGYLGLLEQKDAVVFTGPIGENRIIRRLVLRNVPAARRVPHLTVPADEEQAILHILRI